MVREYICMVLSGRNKKISWDSKNTINVNHSLPLEKTTVQTTPFQHSAIQQRFIILGKDFVDSVLKIPYGLNTEFTPKTVFHMNFQVKADCIDNSSWSKCIV